MDSKEIKCHREYLDMTQAELAEALGLKRSSAPAVCDWEKGRIKIPKHHEEKIIELVKTRLWNRYIRNLHRKGKIEINLQIDP